MNLSKNTQRVIGLAQIGFGVLLVNANVVNPDGSQTTEQITAANKLIGVLGGITLTLGAVSIIKAGKSR